MSYTTTFQYSVLTLAVLSTFGIAQQAQAETAEKIVTAPVVVTATRVEQNSFDLPVAIDVVESKDIQNGQLQMTLSESLIRVPGITAQNRTQSAQDPQISSRGFGSRSSFGVRGVRVYVDGIPLTMPDGQGQPGVVDLSAVKSIEVMRGPFSALYGNSSGGVIQMLTKDAPKTPEVGATVMFGSYDTKRQILDAAGTAENIEYLVNVSNFETNGYRDHSASNKQQATAKFKINISEDTKINALLNWFEQEAEDPLGLPRVATANDPSAFTNPKAAPNSAYNANTKVSRNHTQVGFNIEHALNSNNKINLMTYAGNRENLQYLSTNVSSNAGRASSISRDFWGTDLRWDNKGSLFNLPYSLSMGLTYGKMNDVRLDINTDKGIKRPIIANNANSALNRDEDNISTNFDQYIQGKISLSDNLDIHAGARHTKVELEVKDHFLSGTANNGNNSGSVEYQKTTPVIGAIWKVTPTINLYANYGKGFETPTFIEAAYNSVNNGAPNLTLKPSESTNYELGLKSVIADNHQLNFNVFKIDTKNEIVTKETNSFNRSVFGNADKTKRTGAELSIDSQYDNNISTYLSYSLLNAKFDSDFTYIPSSGTPTTILSGNKIPGTYRSQIYGELAWRYAPLGFKTALEARHNSKVYVNDINTDSAHAYTIFNIRAGFEQNLANWRLSEYVRVENLSDKNYIGSVRVNDSNLRFFEPAAGRNYLLGLSAQYKF
ncbi:TonB-dependent receptor [Methylotenera oryzisoli]|uniref:TonB-dependent receptor n=1 Tax=Methylotenera oryzisoli TaxID=2080758 RepID=A0A4Y9VS62_9PROT|nr:TonB-dependent receptor [Methylotenera oryzisoli]TFW71197.1 TonB-dependent receptor [Methylotenera oryzisoli]